MKVSANKSTVFRVLVFILCALPGLGLFLLCFLSLLGISDSDSVGHINLIAPGIGVIIGLVLILIGVGKLRQIEYGLVFLSIPLSLISYTIFDQRLRYGKFTPIIFTAVVAFFVNYIVKKHYIGRGVIVQQDSVDQK